jgi:hypothetical protein
MTAPSRRWFRFGLRTLFVVVTVLGLLISWRMNVARQHRTHYARLTEHGWSIDGGNSPLNSEVERCWYRVKEWLGYETVHLIEAPYPDVPDPEFNWAKEVLKMRQMFPEIKILTSDGKCGWLVDLDELQRSVEDEAQQVTATH